MLLDKSTGNKLSQFCLSEKVSILPWLLKDHFVGQIFQLFFSQRVSVKDTAWHGERERQQADEGASGER